MGRKMTKKNPMLQDYNTNTSRFLTFVEIMYNVFTSSDKLI